MIQPCNYQNIPKHDKRISMGKPTLLPLYQLQALALKENSNIPYGPHHVFA